MALVGIGRSRPFPPCCAHGPCNRRHKPGKIRNERVKISGSHHVTVAVAARGVAPRQRALFFQPCDASLRGVHDATGALGDAIETEAAHILPMWAMAWLQIPLVGKAFCRRSCVTGDKALHLRQPSRAVGEGQGRLGVVALKGDALRRAVGSAAGSAQAPQPANSGPDRRRVLMVRTWVLRWGRAQPAPRRGAENRAQSFTDSENNVFA